MVHDQTQAQYRSKEAVKGVEAQEGGFGQLSSAQEDLLQYGANQRHPAQELGHYLSRPNGLRVPTQDVAGKIETKGSEQEDHADQPICLPGGQVSPRRDHA